MLHTHTHTHSHRQASVWTIKAYIYDLVFSLTAITCAAIYVWVRDMK